MSCCMRNRLRSLNLNHICWQVTWQRSEGEYTVEELQQAFSQHGPVVDVVLLQSKKKAKGSALVQMGTLPSAAAAAQVDQVNTLRHLLLSSVAWPAHALAAECCRWPTGLIGALHGLALLPCLLCVRQIPPTSGSRLAHRTNWTCQIDPESQFHVLPCDMSSVCIARL